MEFQILGFVVDKDKSSQNEIKYDYGEPIKIIANGKWSGYPAFMGTISFYRRNRQNRGFIPTTEYSYSIYERMNSCRIFPNECYMAFTYPPILSTEDTTISICDLKTAFPSISFNETEILLTRKEIYPFTSPDHIDSLISDIYFGLLDSTCQLSVLDKFALPHEFEFYIENKVYANYGNETLVGYNFVSEENVKRIFDSGKNFIEEIGSPKELKNIFDDLHENPIRGHGDSIPVKIYVRRCYSEIVGYQRAIFIYMRNNTR